MKLGIFEVPFRGRQTWLVVDVFFVRVPINNRESETSDLDSQVLVAHQNVRWANGAMSYAHVAHVVHGQNQLLAHVLGSFLTGFFDSIKMGFKISVSSELLHDIVLAIHQKHFPGLDYIWMFLAQMTQNAKVQRTGFEVTLRGRAGLTRVHAVINLANKRILIEVFVGSLLHRSARVSFGGTLEFVGNSILVELILVGSFADIHIRFHSVQMVDLRFEQRLDVDQLAFIKREIVIWLWSQTKLVGRATHGGRTRLVGIGNA